MKPASYRHFQNGLVALGAFYALAHQMEEITVFVFAMLFWGWPERGKR